MYNFDEGAFELPEGWVDRTVNIFERREQIGGDVFTLARQKLDGTKTLAQLVDEYVDETSTKLRRFDLASRSERTIGALPAQVVRFTWLHSEKGAMLQHHAFIQYGELLLVFTLTSMARNAAVATARFDALVSTFKFREAVSGDVRLAEPSGPHR